MACEGNGIVTTHKMQVKFYSPYKVTFRDRLAYRLSNFIFNFVATRRYSQFVSVVVALGLKSFDESVKRLTDDETGGAAS